MDSVSLVPLSWLLPLAALALYVGSPRFLGTTARRYLGRVLRTGLDARRYSVFEGLVLPAGGGTFRPDALVVSRHGIFVIHAEQRRGRISGTGVQARWIERRLGRSARFDNPVYANTLRVEQLQRLLSLPASRFHSLVAVVGRDRQDPGLPREVVAANRIVGRVRAESRPLLSAEEADRAAATLRQVAIPPSRAERGVHWQWLRAVLTLAVLGGVYVSYRGEIDDLSRHLRTLTDRPWSPDAAGEESMRARWEESLVCSHSVDTGRCACYEPGGARAEIDPGRCRDLAERGSVLQR